MHSCAGDDAGFMACASLWISGGSAVWYPVSCPAVDSATWLLKRCCYSHIALSSNRRSEGRSVRPVGFSMKE